MTNSESIGSNSSFSSILLFCNLKKNFSWMSHVEYCFLEQVLSSVKLPFKVIREAHCSISRPFGSPHFQSLLVSSKLITLPLSNFASNVNVEVLRIRPVQKFVTGRKSRVLIVCLTDSVYIWTWMSIRCCVHNGYIFVG